MERFFDHWIMANRMAGVSWDALESATGLESVAPVKGPSMSTVSERIDQMLGELDAYDPEDDIPRDPKQPIRPGIGLDRLMLVYLPQLHPYIAKGCSRLFIDGHYAQAVEESAKAVFQYIREVTSLHR